MHSLRKRRFIWILILLATSGVITFLVLQALRQHINLFFTPSEIVLKKPSPNALIRIGGIVQKKSVVKDTNNTLKIAFNITDFSHSIKIFYEGILPDLFKEGQGVVVLGHLENANTFRATEVLAKHDENYTPPNIKGAQK